MYASLCLVRPNYQAISPPDYPVDIEPGAPYITIFIFPGKSWAVAPKNLIPLPLSHPPLSLLPVLLSSYSYGLTEKGSRIWNLSTNQFHNEGQLQIPGSLLRQLRALSLLFSSAAALPREQPQLEKRAAADIWVTIDGGGAAHTITPVITTTNGATTTLSTAPPDLYATGTYVLSPSGHETTFTGSPPVAAPTGAGWGGSFMFCDVYQAASSFCQPKEGSQLTPGKSYYSKFKFTCF